MSTYKMYNKRQLQAKAEELLQQYRDNMSETNSKDFDVYQVIEKCLRVDDGKTNDYDWKRLSCDGSILGTTAFQAGYIDVYEDKDGNLTDIPRQLWVERGTILIESSLSEKGPVGRENFTVMHEVFHWILHQKFFTTRGHSVAIANRIDKFSHRRPHKEFKTSLERVEWQANYAAACFLMPECEVCNAFKRGYDVTRGHFASNTLIMDLIRLLAEWFHVTPEAMLYRVQELKENGRLG